jgi:hypothetical protein
MPKRMYRRLGENADEKKLWGVDKKKRGKKAMTAENEKKSRKSTEKIKLSFLYIELIINYSQIK